MAELWLVCEGQRDVAVLRPVFTRSLPADISVEGAGGDRAIAAVAEYIAQRGGTVAYVCDRDYRSREEAEGAFTDGKRAFYWRRHSIENYLLQPAVVAEGFTRLRDDLTRAPRGLPAWATVLPTDATEIADLLNRCAEMLAPREAARMAAWQLWEDLFDTAGRIQHRTPASPLASDAAACREALVSEANRLLEKARETAASLHLTPAAVEARYNQILAEVTAEGYRRDLGFLQDFNGHDLFDQFRSLLQERSIRFSEDRLADLLINALPEVYGTTRTLFGKDDFRDLANGVRALAGLPSLV